MAAVEAGYTVLAPNTELAAALFDAVERAHQEAGREIWPTPRLRDFGGWLREAHAARQLADAALPRVLGDIDERELWRTVIDSSEAGGDILEPAGAARAARRARRVMLEYGIPLTAVASHAAASEESRAFLDWNRRFEQRCRELDCIGADELLARTPAPAQPIAWIESPAWRPAARGWLEHHGRNLTPAAAAPRAPPRRLHAASPAAELAAVAEWARENLRADEGFRAWVCVPDLALRRAEVVDAMDAVLAPRRFALIEGAAAAPYAVAGGTPLAEFAPVRAALQFLAASLGRLPFEGYSALLRAPQLHASVSEAGAAALLDVHLRSQGPSEADLAAWLALSERIAAAHAAGAVPAVARLRDALLVLEDLRGHHPISRWVPAWITALHAGVWELRHRWSSVEYQAAERFRELLGQLAAADAVFGTPARSSAQRILERAARDTAFQVQTGIPPVWVSGQLNDPYLSYEGIWIAGCSDARWPPPADPIPLLPVGLQREFGVVAAAPESQLRSALDLQSRWTARGPCVFSYADSVDGRPAAPSPLLPRAATERSPALPRPHWRELLQAAPVLEEFTDEIAPPFSAAERTRGVSTLKAQSRCAFRGFAETRLSTLELEKPVPGFNDRERGELVHHALEHIWSRLRDWNSLMAIERSAEERLLDEAAARALALVCRVRDPGPRWRLRERARMRDVLRRWLEVERQREPFEVEALEQGKQRVRHANLDFSLRIDRVDRLADGSRVLLDYKTGMASVDWRGERPDNPQLPLYALWRPESLVAVAYGRVNALECGFIAEAERPGIFKPRGQKSALEGRASLAELIQVWSLRMERLAADFAAGRAAVAPTLRACRSCALQGLCRVPAALDEAATVDEAAAGGARVFS